MDSWWDSLASSAQKLAGELNEIGDSIIQQVKEAEEQIEAEQRNVSSGGSNAKQASQRSRSEGAGEGSGAASEASSSSSSSSAGTAAAPVPESPSGPLLALSTTLLPWEAESESASILSTDLMDSVLALSHHEANFLRPPAAALLCDVPFVLTPYVSVLMRVLAIDVNLKGLHAKLVPRMRGARGGEEGFWRNYYHRLVYLRAVVGIDAAQDEEELNALLLKGDGAGVDGGRKAFLTERIRLRKQIAKLPANEVLFVDPVPAPPPAPAAAKTAEQHAQPSASSSTTTPGRNAAVATSGEGAGPSRATATSSTAAGVNTTPSLHGNGSNQQRAAAPTNTNKAGDGNDTAAARSIKKILLSDQELDAEIEAELNEVTPPRRAAPTSSSSHNSTGNPAPAPAPAPAAASVAAASRAPLPAAGKAAAAAADDDDLALEDLSVGDGEGLDDIDVELDDLDIDEDDLSDSGAGAGADDDDVDVSEEEERAYARVTCTDGSSSGTAGKTGSASASPINSGAAGGGASVGSSQGSVEIVPSAAEIRGEISRAKP